MKEENNLIKYAKAFARVDRRIKECEKVLIEVTEAVNKDKTIL